MYVYFMLNLLENEMNFSAVYSVIMCKVFLSNKAQQHTNKFKCWQWPCYVV